MGNFVSPHRRWRRLAEAGRFPVIPLCPLRDAGTPPSAMPGTCPGMARPVAPVFSPPLAAASGAGDGPSRGRARGTVAKRHEMSCDVMVRDEFASLRPGLSAGPALIVILAVVFINLPGRVFGRGHCRRRRSGGGRPPGGWRGRRRVRRWAWAAAAPRFGSCSLRPGIGATLYRAHLRAGAGACLRRRGSRACLPAREADAGRTSPVG